MNVAILLMATSLVGLAQDVKLIDYATTNQSGIRVVTPSKHIEYIYDKFIGPNEGGTKWAMLNGDGQMKKAGEVGSYIAAHSKLDVTNEYPYQTLQQIWEPKPTQFQFLLTGIQNHFHLHSKWQDIVIDDPASPTNGNSGADAATFSYSDDKIKNTTTWRVTGTLFYDLTVYSNALITRFVPSVYANKVTSSTTKSNVDELVFRTSFETRDSRNYSLRYGAFYTTDSDFKSGQYGGEVEFEPFKNNIRLGMRNTLIPGQVNIVDIRWRLYGHVEVGHIVDTGGNPLISGQQSYCRMGPYAQLELFPLPQTFDWRLVEKTSFMDDEKINTGVRSTRLFSTELDYLLGPKKNVSLGVSYKKGRDQFSAQEENRLDVALGLQF